jgi:hypothetical protein
MQSGGGDVKDSRPLKTESESVVSKIFVSNWPLLQLQLQGPITAARPNSASQSSPISYYTCLPPAQAPVSIQSLVLAQHPHSHDGVQAGITPSQPCSAQPDKHNLHKGGGVTRGVEPTCTITDQAVSSVLHLISNSPLPNLQSQSSPWASSGPRLNSTRIVSSRHTASRPVARTGSRPTVWRPVSPHPLCSKL